MLVTVWIFILGTVWIFMLATVWIFMSLCVCVCVLWGKVHTNFREVKITVIFSSDLWLNYAEMERVIAKDSARSGNIQQRALTGLDPHLKETFLRKQVMLGLGS